MHGLPEHAQLANAESYKVLNDFIDTASIFVEPARAASGSTKTTPTASDSSGSTLPTVSQAKYDMEFYVKLSTEGVAAPQCKSHSSHQGEGSDLINGGCEDQLGTQIVNLTLKVPKQHRTMQQGQNALAAAEVWHDLVRSCLRSLVGTVATPQNPLPEWIVKPARKRSLAKAQKNHWLTRKQVEQKLRQAFAEDGAFVGAEVERAHEAVLDFDLGAFPEAIQQFVLQHVVLDSGHTLLTTRRHHLNELEAKAIPRLAVAILRHADELGLSTSLPEDVSSASDGLAVVISSRQAVAQEVAAATAAADQEEQKSGRHKRLKRQKVRLFGPDGVRLRSKRSGEVVVAADGFDEEAFVDNLIRAKENVGLFEAEEGPLH